MAEVSNRGPIFLREGERGRERENRGGGSRRTCLGDMFERDGRSSRGQRGAGTDRSQRVTVARPPESARARPATGVRSGHRRGRSGSRRAAGARDAATDGSQRGQRGVPGHRSPHERGVGRAAGARRGHQASADRSAGGEVRHRSPHGRGQGSGNRRWARPPASCSARAAGAGAWRGRMARPPAGCSAGAAVDREEEEKRE